MNDEKREEVSLEELRQLLIGELENRGIKVSGSIYPAEESNPSGRNWTHDLSIRRGLWGTILSLFVNLRPGDEDPYSRVFRDVVWDYQKRYNLKS